jgi:putative DNA primase/helicase
MFRHDSDVLGRFLDDVCNQDIKLSAPAGELYRSYNTWFLESGENIYGRLAMNKFKESLEARGFMWYKTKKGAFYKGLGVRQGEHVSSPPPAEDGEDRLPF